MLSVHEHMENDIPEQTIRKAGSRDMLASVIWLSSSENAAAVMTTSFVFKGTEIVDEKN